MKIRLLIFLLSIQSLAWAQQIAWERIIKQGFDQTILQATSDIEGNLVLLEASRPSGQSLRNKYISVIDSNGNYSTRTIPSLECERFNILGNTGSLLQLSGKANDEICNWCALGIMGHWMYYEMDINTLDLRLNVDLNYSDDVCQLAYHSLSEQLYALYTNTNYFPQCRGFFKPNDTTIVQAGHRLITRQRFQQSPNYEKFIQSFDWKISADSIIGMQQANDSVGLACSADSLYAVDTSLTLQALAALPFHTDSVAWFPAISRLACFRNDSIAVLRMDGLLDTIYSYGDWGISSLLQFEPLENGYRILGQTNSGKQYRSVENGEITLSIAPDSSDFEVMQFSTIDNAHVYLIGFEKHYPNRHIIVRKYVPSASFTASNLNLGISTIEEVGTKIVRCNQSFGSNTVDYTNISMTVDVSNYSDTPVDSFYINADWDITGPPGFLGVNGQSYSYSCNIFCFDTQFSIPVKHTLLPGETVRIPFNIKNGVDTLQVFPFCVWVSLPNNARDIDSADDFTCRDIHTGLEDLDAKKASCVFPNPASNAFRINQIQGDVSSNYSIQNTLGQVVQTGKIQAEWSDISVANLPNGLYILTHWNSTSRFSTLLEVQHQ